MEFFSEERRIIHYSLLTLPFREDLIDKHIKLKMEGTVSTHEHSRNLRGKKTESKDL